MLDRFHRRFHWRGPGRDLTIDGWSSRVYDRIFARCLLRRFYRCVATRLPWGLYARWVVSKATAVGVGGPATG